MSKTPLYAVWKTMRARCNRPGNENYARYGGRGIRVCDEWDKSFVAFRDAVGDMPAPGYTIERIDNDGHYEPGNVRWATPLDQAQNTRNVRSVEIDGRTQSVSAWAREVGISEFTVFRRLNRGWPPMEAVYAPLVRAYKGQPKFGRRCPGPCQ